MEPKKYEIDYAAIKARVSIEDLVHRYGFQLRNGRGRCKLPSHTNPKDDNSFSIEHKKGAGAWACWSDSCVANRLHTRGRKGGGIFELTAEMERTTTIKEAAGKLAEWYGLNGTPIVNPQKPDCKPQGNKPNAIKFSEQGRR